MKKRAMKKYIPFGIYCHGPLTSIEGKKLLYKNSCPWLKRIKKNDSEYGEYYLNYCIYENTEIMDDVKECFVKYDD